MRLFTFLAVLFFGFVATAQTADDFVFEVDLSSSGNSTYNFYITHVGNVSINWGDGQTSFFPNSQNRLVSHTYNINGNYTIYLNGQIDSFSFNRNEPLEVVQWGFSQFQTMEGAFEGCQNLVINSVDHPNLSQVTSMSNMFNGAKNFNSDISAWDVSNVTDMSGTFRLNWTFNINISNWDVSNVINMDEMFNSAILFNQPIGSWDVANVIDFTYMFLGAADFNQDLSSWDFQQTANLQDMLFSANLDTYNYDALIRNFLNLQLINKNLGISNFEYCDVFSRSQLTNRGWTITNDRQASNCSNQTLIGNILLDGDQNGCDFLDINVNTIAVNVNDGNYSFNYFTIDGAYSANLRPGNYTVVPIVDSQLFNITPDSIIITITPSGIVNQDFCVTATTPIDDLEITILPLEGARPGFDTNYKLIYKNKGNTRLSGSVDFTYEDDFMDFLNSNPATTSSSTGMLSWDFIDLDPFETREIEFTMNLNTPTDPNFPLNSNDVINFTAIINPALNDSTPLDNVFNIKQQVVNSYDPNDKTCLQGNRITPSMVG
ncbi:BspA family leucine-rich repeat surface protein [Nonlabens dokdonensis]|uniref:BspA family leucine-rich repeat surface protein n=1 Tax=Nonlabens dokdonensis TaxID=328515 RepID=UPI0026EB8950|nr:BspA family leucine-rich repeat surface protein [Nonlabens dokdonensis]